MQISMPVIVQDSKELLSGVDAERLWRETCAHTQHADDEVTVRLVDEAEIRRLNREYRGKDALTNILTFSYGEGIHDIALCWSVGEREAKARGVAVREYAALLLVHGYLHAVGFDHERSAPEAAKTKAAEEKILAQAGFTSTHL
jgi:probable rRNA maturation factor